MACLLSWMVATAIFIGIIALLGGPTQNDASESLYATWAIAHGNLACAYPPASGLTSSFFPFFRPHPAVPPLWPLLSGGVASLTRIGHTLAFPSQHALGANCVNGFAAMYGWAQNSYAMFPTIGLGYLSWFVLLAGVVALLRASGRGRSGWEVFTVLFIALVPMVWMPLLDQYHPQDLVAVGLVLAALACVERSAWIWAGVFLGLAVTSQQFALLVLLPLFVVAPGRARWKLLASGAGAGLLISLPVLIATSGRAVHSVVLGTGDSATFGGTVLWELRLTGPALVFSSRMLPILIAVALAWWALRRLGSGVLEPVPLISLAATCLSLRLVFEQGIFGYKFMALSIMLIILNVVRGRVRGELVVWLVLVSLAFQPVPAGLAINARPWAYHIASAYPLICIGVALVLIIRDAFHALVRWYLVVFFVIAACAFLQWPLWSPDSLRAALPLWFWQVALLVPGVVMAVGPLLRLMEGGIHSGSPATVENARR